MHDLMTAFPQKQLFVLVVAHRVSSQSIDQAIGSSGPQG